MNRFRRFATAFWLALALLVGQQAGALHALGHATEQVSHKKEGNTKPSVCEQCSLFAGLSSGVVAKLSVPPIVVGAVVRSFHLHLGAPSTARLAYRSRAPPAAAA